MANINKVTFDLTYDVISDLQVKFYMTFSQFMYGAIKAVFASKIGTLVRQIAACGDALALSSCRVYGSKYSNGV